MLTDERIDVATRDLHGLPESQGRPEEPYEHAALESEAGYWAGRWAEFKRLLGRSWNNGYNKPTIIGSVLVVVGTVTSGRLFDWP